MEPTPASRLWRNRGFNVFWAGQALSVLGDAFAMVATPLLVLQATGSVEQMGRYSAVASCGFIVAGLASGVLVDRVDRRKLMIACDATRFLMWLTIPLCWWFRGPSLPLLYVVGGCGALFGNIFQVACITAVANLVDRDQIIEANGRLQATFALMYCIGPTLSGLICHQVGPVWALGIDALSFGISAASLFWVRLKRGAPRPAGAMHPLAELWEGMRFLLRQPVLRAVAVLLGLCSLVLGAQNDLIVFHLKQTLGQSDAGIGRLFGVAAIGAIGAGLMASRLRARFGFAACWLGGGLLLGIGVGAIGINSNWASVAAAATIAAFSNTLRGVNSMSYRQEVTPDHLLGRVTAAFWLLTNGPLPIGALVCTGLAARIGSGPALEVLGLVVLALGGLGFATAIRDEREVTAAIGEIA